MSTRQQVTLMAVNGGWKLLTDGSVEGGGGGSTPLNLPIFASPSLGQGQDQPQAYKERYDAGWGTAFYTYWPGDFGAFTASWQTLTSEIPDGVPVLGSPKGTSASAIQGFFDPMPQAWRDKFIAAYFQEPEDNFTDDTARAQYRASVALMADRVRPYGVRNAVHLQEWAINPYNNNSWAGTTQAQRYASLAKFVQGIEDKIDYVSWSSYPAKGKSFQPGFDRIADWCATYLPGVPWGVTAAGSPVENISIDPIGGAARATRAQIVRDGGDHLAAIYATTGGVGGQAFGWFDFDEYNPGRDQLASKDPALTDALLYVAQINLTN